MQTPRLSELELVDLATRLVELDGAIAELTAARDDVKERIRALGIGNYPAGHYTIKVTPQRRFSLDKARELFDDGTLKPYALPGFDAKRFKAEVAPAIYEACMVPFGVDRVTVS